MLDEDDSLRAILIGSVAAFVVFSVLTGSFLTVWLVWEPSDDVPEVANAPAGGGQSVESPEDASSPDWLKATPVKNKPRRSPEPRRPKRSGPIPRPSKPAKRKEIPSSSLIQGEIMPFDPKILDPTDEDIRAQKAAAAARAAAASAPPSQPSPSNLKPNQVHLTDLKPSINRVWGKPRIPYTPPAKLGNYNHCLWGHPPNPRETSCITFDLQKSYAQLAGSVGLEFRTHTLLTFRIEGDGRELWRSQPVRSPGVAESFTVDLSGVKVLALFVDCPGSHIQAHALWIDPILSTAATGGRDR